MKYAEDLKNKHEELLEKQYKTVFKTWAGNMPRPPAECACVIALRRERGLEPNYQGSRCENSAVNLNISQRTP